MLFFILEKLSINYLPERSNLHFALFHLGKVFEKVSGDSFWWMLISLDVDECLFISVKSIYMNVQIQFKLNSSFIFIALLVYVKN